jgi:hypothetical protein
MCEQHKHGFFPPSRQKPEIEIHRSLRRAEFDAAVCQQLVQRFIRGNDWLAKIKNLII